MNLSYGDKGGGDQERKGAPARKSSGPYAKADDLFCPVCGMKAVGKCRCSIGSLRCINGHDWYYGEDKKPILGTGHQNEQRTQPEPEPPRDSTPLDTPVPRPQMLPYDIKIDSKCHGKDPRSCSHLILILVSPSEPWTGVGDGKPVHGSQIVDLLKRMKKPIPTHFKPFV